MRMQCLNVKGGKVKNIKPKITPRYFIEEENWRTQHKNLSMALQAEMIY